MYCSDTLKVKFKLTHPDKKVEFQTKIKSVYRAVRTVQTLYFQLDDTNSGNAQGKRVQE